MKIAQSLSVDTTKLDKGLFGTEEGEAISNLKQYLRANPKQLYATPQLIDAEKPLSIIVLRIKKKKQETLMTMINPLILATREIIASEETQPGVEGVYLNFRHVHLHIAYNALPGCVPTEVTLTGKSAIVFQQALRLTQGITIDTYGLRIDNYPEYQLATEEEKQDIFREYIRALKEVHQEMLEDKDTAEYIKATEFLAEKVQHSVEDEFKESLQDAREEIVAATKEIVKKETQVGKLVE